MLTFGETRQRFSVECCKTETKFITLANQKGNRQFNKPIKTRNIYMQLKKIAGKNASDSQLALVLLLDEKVERLFFLKANRAE